MAATSDAIRRDIEDTRTRLGREIDELADRTLPNRIVKRHWPVRRGKAGPNGAAAGTGVAPGADDTDSVLDPEPGDVATDAMRTRLILAGIAAAAAGLTLAWLLRSRSRRG